MVVYISVKNATNKLTKGKQQKGKVMTLRSLSTDCQHCVCVVVVVVVVVTWGILPCTAASTVTVNVTSGNVSPSAESFDVKSV